MRIRSALALTLLAGCQRSSGPLPGPDGGIQQIPTLVDAPFDTVAQDAPPDAPPDAPIVVHLDAFP